MASNTELSEIKQLLYCLTSDLKAVQSDLAELKKTQTQTSEATSTCSSCAARSSKPSNVEKAPRNTETKLVAKVCDTQSAVLQLVEEEKVLILAEVVQLSRAVGKALEDAKGKMLGKVAGITNGKEHGRKRSRSTENINADDDLDVAEKRVKQDEQSDTYEYKWGEEDGFTQRRRNCTALDGFVLDTMGRASMAFDCERVGPEWVLLALITFHDRANDCCIEDWDRFQKEGKIGFAPLISLYLALVESSTPSPIINQHRGSVKGQPCSGKSNNELTSLNIHDRLVTAAETSRRALYTPVRPCSPTSTSFAPDPSPS